MGAVALFNRVPVWALLSQRMGLCHGEPFGWHSQDGVTWGSDAKPSRGLELSKKPENPKNLGVAHIYDTLYIIVFVL